MMSFRCTAHMSSPHSRCISCTTREVGGPPVEQNSKVPVVLQGLLISTAATKKIAQMAHARFLEIALDASGSCWKRSSLQGSTSMGANPTGLPAGARVRHAAACPITLPAFSDFLLAPPFSLPHMTLVRRLLTLTSILKSWSQQLAIILRDACRPSWGTHDSKGRSGRDAHSCNGTWACSLWHLGMLIFPPHFVNFK